MPPKVLVGPNPDPGLGSGEGTPDETNSSCPSINHASDSMATATPEAKGWLAKNSKPEYYDDTLGKGYGGGFLAGQATTKVIPAGTTVFRAAGNLVDAAGKFISTARVDGGWWAPTLPADPVRELALPPGNPATNVVEGVTTQDIEVLAGPGAPRCSNKPGGPEQFFFGPGPVAKGLIKLK